MIPHRVDIGPGGLRPRDRSFVRCWNCGNDLRAASTVNTEKVLLSFTQHLERVVSSGHLALGGNPNLHSISYFAGLRIVARIVSNSLGFGRSAIELLHLHDRLVILESMAKIMESWPSGFLKTLDQSCLRYSDFVHKRAEVPFWFEEEVHSWKCNRHSWRSDAEVDEIARVIVSRHGRMSTGIARKLYGVNLKPRRFSATYHPAVSDELHRQLMTHIDHAIKKTSNAKKRECFSQNKVIFSLLRYAEMSIQEIVNLRHQSLSFLLQDVNCSDDFDVPASRNESFRMLQRFAGCPSPIQVVGRRNQYVFVSPYTGRALSESTVQLRFRRAIDAAGLIGFIPNLMAYKRKM